MQKLPVDIQIFNDMKDEDFIYIDQSYQDLNLTILDKKPDISDINVIKSLVLSHNKIDIEIAIIGASHYIYISGDRFEFFEMLACHNIQNSQNIKYLKSQDLKSQFFEYYCDIEDMDYYTNIDRFDNFLSLKNRDNSYKLEYIFDNSLKFIATTQLYIKLDYDRIVLETLHSYPNQDRLVFTKSVFVDIRKVGV